MFCEALSNRWTWIQPLDSWVQFVGGRVGEDGGCGGERLKVDIVERKGPL